MYALLYHLQRTSATFLGPKTRKQIRGSNYVSLYLFLDSISDSSFEGENTESEHPECEEGLWKDAGCLTVHCKADCCAIHAYLSMTCDASEKGAWQKRARTTSRAQESVGYWTKSLARPFLTISWRAWRNTQAFLAFSIATEAHCLWARNLLHIEQCVGFANLDASICFCMGCNRVSEF